MGMFTKKLTARVKDKRIFDKMVAKTKVASFGMAADIFKNKTFSSGLKGLQGAMKEDSRYNQPGAKRSEKQIAALLKAQGISAKKRRKN